MRVVGVVALAVAPLVSARTFVERRSHVLIFYGSPVLRQAFATLNHGMVVFVTKTACVSVCATVAAASTCVEISTHGGVANAFARHSCARLLLVGRVRTECGEIRGSKMGVKTARGVRGCVCVFIEQSHGYESL